MCCGVHDVITGNKFHQNRSRGFRATGVQKLGSPIDLACRPYNSSALLCWLWWSALLHRATIKRYTKKQKHVTSRRGHPRCRSPISVYVCGHTRDLIIYSKFNRNPFRCFGATGGQNLPVPITLPIGFCNSLHYHASRDDFKLLKTTEGTIETAVALPGNKTSDIGINNWCCPAWRSAVLSICQLLRASYGSNKAHFAVNNVKWCVRTGTTEASTGAWAIIGCTSSLTAPAKLSAP